MTFRSLQPLDIENLKCALCQNYLSTPPIMVISEIGDKLKCGRCQCIKTQINTGIQFFEDMIKLIKFPCIYTNCKEELSWGAVEAHEQMCPHKTYRCTLLENCSDVITIEDLKIHYITKKHDKFGMVHGKLKASMECLDLIPIHVLIKNKVPYLIYSDQTKHDLWLAVFSLRSKLTKTTKYEVKLSTTESDISVLYENGIITPYNEREHCANCLFAECSLPYHKFSKVNEGHTDMITYIQRTIISKTRVSKTLGSIKLISTVTILDEPEMPEINKPALATCNNNRLFQRILRCPICLELMPAEIYTCRTGHAICNTCKPQLQACPTCKNELSDSRSYALEEIAENIELACEYQEQGCNYIGSVANISRHQEQCSYKRS